jgi:L-threonylcarbamoyladenylate synthase
LKKKTKTYMSEQKSRPMVGTSLDVAVSSLRRGGIVAFPTETCYGLAVDPDCALAVERLFSLKKRAAENPLLLLIEKKEQLASVVLNVPRLYWPLIEKYWPGPLTLIFPALPSLSRRITGNTGTVGIRISPHPIAQELVKRMGKPITATSANISGFPPARSAPEIVKMFGESIDYIIDGGATEAELCSTILGLQKGQLSLVRHGQIDVSKEIGGGKII